MIIGILQRATDAKEQTERASVIEQAKTDVLGYQAENKGGNIYKSQLKSVLDTYFKDVPTIEELPDGDDLLDLPLTTLDKYGTHIIKVSEIYSGSIKGNTTGNSSSDIAGAEVEKPNNWTTLQGKAISDGNGTAIPLPTGFYYVGGAYDTGLVISDKENDTMDASGLSMGNQFVWIPVPNEATITRTDFNNNGNAINSIDSNYTEPLNYYDAENDETYTGYSGENTDYENMKRQVIKYGGFYIGRYESGINSTELKSNASKDQTIVVKKMVAPFNYVPWGNNVDDIESISSYGYYDWDDEEWVVLGESYGAVYLSKKMYENSNSVTSTLCYGSQWDAMCRYIGADNSKKTVATKSTVELTGSDTTDVSKNIYDLAGNCKEWTMEADQHTGRVQRGGSYETSATIFSRFGHVPNFWNSDTQEDNCTFRIALYLK